MTRARFSARAHVRTRAHFCAPVCTISYIRVRGVKKKNINDACGLICMRAHAPHKGAFSLPRFAQGMARQGQLGFWRAAGLLAWSQ